METSIHSGHFFDHVTVNGNVTLSKVQNVNTKHKIYINYWKYKIADDHYGETDAVERINNIFSGVEEFNKSSEVRILYKKFFKVTHCLFDMDGTVLNTEIMYHKMIKQLCDKYNKKYRKDLQVKLYGETDKRVCTTVVKELKMPISADEFERQLNDIAQKVLPSAPLQKGAERLLTHLHDHKIPMALATNSTEQAVRLQATARPKLFGLFHHKVSVTDSEVYRGKPHPDIYLVAAARFPDKPKPKQCLVFEDSAVGVQAAKEAGMQVVMIPDSRIDREQTRQATLVVKSLMDFKPEMFGLPPFDESPRRSSQYLEKNNAS